MRTQIFRTLAVQSALVLLGGMAQAAEFYVSPTATSAGNGTIGSPWTFTTALGHPAAVKPGDTIWMRGGTYTMKFPAEFWSKLSGTSTAPIIVRRYPGEKVIIDLKSMASSLFVYGKYTWFWGLEILSTGLPRATGDPGPWTILNSSVEVAGPGTKFINCYIHDLSSGLSLWRDSIDSEAYGNIIQHIGWQGGDRGHGHAIYSQNLPGGTKRKLIAENFLSEAFDIGVQLYGSGSAVVQDYQLTGNVIWDNGLPSGQNVDQIIIAGGGTSKKNIELDSNFAVNTANAGLNRVGWQWDGRNGDLNIHDNWFVGGYNVLEVWNWDKVTFRNNFVCTDAGYRQLFVGLYQAAGQLPSAYSWDQNRYCAGTMKYAQTALDSQGNSILLSGSNGTVASYLSTTGFDKLSTFGTRPTTGADVFVRPNKYETGRANIVILNWGKAPSVVVDLSKSGLKDGDAWVIRDVQNFNGTPVASGVYTSSYPKATVPMTGLVKKQISGWSPVLKHTAPAFGTFVLLGGAALDGGGAPAPVDTTPPTVAITSPFISQTISGIVNVMASASDNIGVASVQFKLDGADLGAAVTATPYQISWNTATATNGVHTLSATARDSAGNQTNSLAISVSVTNVASPPPPAGTSAASFVKLDTATRGNWKSVYGGEGALIANDYSGQPSYGQATFSNTNLWVWDSSPSNLQSLLRQNGNRIASCWYQGSGFTLDVTINDGKTHQVALYVLDYDSQTRGQRIDAVNPTTGAVLDSRTISAFNGGMYLVWNLSGKVRFKFSRISGANAVVSGVFFGAATGAAPADTTPPSIQITSPTANQTVSGTINLSATASDNVGVSGVQFKVDGAANGSEKLAGPYTFSWNSATVPNGSHVLSTVARDAAGNTATASITVNVANSVPTGTLPAPAGYWTMNDSDSLNGVHLDKSSSGLNLTALNVTSAAGRLREALSFNGYNGALVSNSASAMDLTSNMTISAWIKTTSSGRQEAIVSKYDTAGTESGYVLKTTTTGGLAFRIGSKNSARGASEVSDSRRVNDGAWHHVAVVVTLGQTITFYVDGVAGAAQSSSSQAGSSPAAFEIGAIVYPYYATFFKGAIDEVKIYKSSLTAAQILQLASGL